MRGLVLVVVIALTGAAGADGPGEARRLYDDGKRAYDQGRYREAIAAWKEAYRISGEHDLLYNMGQAARLSGDCDTALGYYRAFLNLRPDSPNRALAGEFIVECEDVVAARERRTRPAPELVERRGHTGRDYKIAGAIIAGSGVLMVGVGILFGFVAEAAEDDLDGYTGLWGPSQVGREREGQEAEAVAVSFVIGGAIAVAAGGVFWYLGRQKERAARVTVAPAPGGGAVVGWSCAF
jgi:tetratricopeptide (TPR) repeat protein